MVPGSAGAVVETVVEALARDGVRGGSAAADQVDFVAAGAGAGVVLAVAAGAGSAAVKVTRGAGGGWASTGVDGAVVDVGDACNAAPLVVAVVVTLEAGLMIAGARADAVAGTGAAVVLLLVVAVCSASSSAAAVTAPVVCAAATAAIVARAGGELGEPVSPSATPAAPPTAATTIAAVSFRAPVISRPPRSARRDGVRHYLHAGAFAMGLLPCVWIASRAPGECHRAGASHYSGTASECRSLTHIGLTSSRSARRS